MLTFHFYVGNPTASFSPKSRHAQPKGIVNYLFNSGYWLYTVFTSGHVIGTATLVWYPCYELIIQELALAVISAIAVSRCQGWTFCSLAPLCYHWYKHYSGERLAILRRCATILLELAITFAEIIPRQTGWCFWKEEELVTQQRPAIGGIPAKLVATSCLTYNYNYIVY